MAVEVRRERINHRNDGQTNRTMSLRPNQDGTLHAGFQQQKTVFNAGLSRRLIDDKAGFWMLVHELITTIVAFGVGAVDNL